MALPPVMGPKKPPPAAQVSPAATAVAVAILDLILNFLKVCLEYYKLALDDPGEWRLTDASCLNTCVLSGPWINSSRRKRGPRTGLALIKGLSEIRFSTIQGILSHCGKTKRKAASMQVSGTTLRQCSCRHLK